MAPPDTMTRRQLLRTSGVLAGQVLVGSSLFTLGCDLSYYGALREPDANGLRLPPGFQSRVLAVTGESVGASGYVWHGWPDGGAVFPDERGWIYVSNAELFFAGGVGALRFDRHGEVVDAYSICAGTRRNCAGGATPWGTWLTCEEVPFGLVHECDPLGEAPAIARPALGRFNHEAVACDPEEHRLYLTEDRSDGRLYRFTPDVWGQLDTGLLEVAEIHEGDRVRWHPVPAPDPAAGQPETRRQVPESTAFDGGEGIVFDGGFVFFTTKGDDRVWELDVRADRIRVIYDRRRSPHPQLSGVDNITTTPDGKLIVAEDGGDMELVQVDPATGLALPLLRVEGQPHSELAGPAFSPDGRRLYFSSQRGFDGRGLTYEVRGPFQSRRRGWRSRHRSEWEKRQGDLS